MNPSLPTRSLPARPALDQLKRQAKELLKAFLAGEQAAIDEVNAHYRDADKSQFALHDAYLVLARAYGFASWPKLKAHVDGLTVKRLVEAVQANDLAQAREMLKVRPELAHMSIDDFQVLHHAVLNRSEPLVRLLMQHGADARAGLYPHRDATSSLTIATERGYDEIVRVIQQEEQRRRDQQSGHAQVPAPDELFRAMISQDQGKASSLLQSNPALVHTRNSQGFTPLHIAARLLNEGVATQLLDLGAGVNETILNRFTPLDAAAYFSSEATSREFERIATLLLGRGAFLTPWAAAALGRDKWLREQHSKGELTNPTLDNGGMLRIAASHGRRDILALLLDFGFDPDERHRMNIGDEDEVVFTWGMPLYFCAANAKHDMAEMLLKRGADPNASVYASGDPVFRAYGNRDWKMVKLLEQHGGVPAAHTAASLRQTELARKMLAGEAPYRLEGAGATLPEALLSAGACGGDPEIVRMALERVDWPRADPKWFGVLEQPLRIWNHGSGNWTDKEMDRGTYLTCFRLILERCDPNVRGRTTDLGQFGLTILHSVAASREHMRPEERVGFATALLEAGARTDLRDAVLKSTPLGWACRWGRAELVQLLLERGADPIEADAESWATPKAWATKMHHADVLALLEDRV